MSGSHADVTGAGSVPSDADTGPSPVEGGSAQSRVAHRIEDLLHGIQTTLFAQEMAAQQQLQSIADVWAATDRYRAAGLVEGPFPRVRKVREDQVTPESQPS
ncbi:MAG: proteasome activator [Dermatophilaceae bacterium]